jgi:FkbM family methyltransferase
VQWFAAEVWPIVRQALPDAEFHIIGAEAPPSVIALSEVPGIRIVGFVQNLDPLLGMFRLGVAPLRCGAGIKGKVATTMGAGIPCVCTDIATEGMGIQDGVHALIANEPQQFAEAVISAYTDTELWNRLSRNGQSLVRERFGVEANRAALLQVLDKARALPLSLFVDYCREAPSAPVPSPGASELVDVSIILPVSNKWELTLTCLNSIVHTSTGSLVNYELILVEVGPLDTIDHAAYLFPGVRLVRATSPHCLLSNCNEAAKAARGRHLLFLNNDMVVLPGWLKELYRTIEADLSAVIVGSKLLSPDSHIQEAGCGLLANGESVCIGRSLGIGERNFPVSRWEPVFNLTRETDCFLGSSILVRRSFWDIVGGVDERFHTFNSAFSDLAMAARSQGMRVIYEPSSELAYVEHHFESDGEEVDRAGIQRRDNQLLVEKWRDTLVRDHLSAVTGWQMVAAHGERIIPAKHAERRKAGKLNILYFSPFPSHPSSHGNQATIQQFGKRFQSLGHMVYFALLKSPIYNADDEQAMREQWDSLDILPNSRPLWADGNPIPFDGWYEKMLGERIRVLCAKYDIDVVFCSYIFQSKLLEFVPSYILKVIDTHDKMGDRYDMLRRNGQPVEFFSCTPEEEGAYLRRADLVVARREEEARYFDAVSGRNTAIVIPHFEDSHFLDKDFNALSRVGIVASANRINLMILFEFLESLGRQLNGRLCPFTVHVAGQVKDMVSSLPPEQAALFARPWVRLRGFVPDIAAFYGEMDVIVSPVTIGTGINVKTVQAMAYGMTLLNTTCGSKGIETDEPMHNHQNLDSLVAGLLRLVGSPAELERLAMLSRNRYTLFLDQALSGFEMVVRNALRKASMVKVDDPFFQECLCNWLYAYFWEGDRSHCVADHRDSQVIMDGVNAASFIRQHMEQRTVHDDDFKMLKAFEAAGSVFLDIGANWGYSVASIWAVAPDQRVISFEPIRAYAEVLEQIKCDSPGKYDYRNVALGDDNKFLKFIVPVVNGIALSALATARDPVPDAHIKSLAKNIQVYVQQFMSNVDIVQFSLLEFIAPVRRLDDLVLEDLDLIGNAPISAIKIDTEGYELNVLRGAEDMIRRHKPIILLERSDENAGIVEFMAGLDYIHAERFGELLRPVFGSGVGANGFFVHKERLETLRQAGIWQEASSKP